MAKTTRNDRRLEQETETQLFPEPAKDPLYERLSPPPPEPQADPEAEELLNIPPERYESIRKRLEKNYRILNPDFYKALEDEEPAPQPVDRDEELRRKVRKAAPWLDPEKSGIDEILNQPLPSLQDQQANGSRSLFAQADTGTPASYRRLNNPSYMDTKPSVGQEGTKPTTPSPAPSTGTGAKVFKYTSPEQKIDQDLDTAQQKVVEAEERLNLLMQNGGTMKDLEDAEAAYREAESAYTSAEERLKSAGAPDPTAEVLGKIENPILRQFLASKLKINMDPERTGQPAKAGGGDPELAAAYRQADRNETFSKLAKMGSRLAAIINRSGKSNEDLIGGDEDNPIKRVLQQREAEEKRRLLQLRTKDQELRAGDQGLRQDLQGLRKQELETKVGKSMLELSKAVGADDPESEASKKLQAFITGSPQLSRYYKERGIDPLNIPASEADRIYKLEQSLREDEQKAKDRAAARAAALTLRDTKRDEKLDDEERRRRERKEDKAEEEEKKVAARRVEGLDFTDPKNPPDEKSYQEMKGALKTHMDLIDSLNRWEATFSENGFSMTGVAADDMADAEEEILLALKNMRELGVLSGNDEVILRRQMPPSTGGSRQGKLNKANPFMTQERVKEAFSRFRKKMEQQIQNAAKVRRYKFPGQGGGSSAAPERAPASPDLDLDKPASGAPAPKQAAPAANRTGSSTPKTGGTVKIQKKDGSGPIIEMEPGKAQKLIGAGLYREVK